MFAVNSDDAVFKQEGTTLQVQYLWINHQWCKVWCNYRTHVYKLQIGAITIASGRAKEKLIVF